MKNLVIVLSLAAATTASAVDYKTQIMPILRAKCYECHSVAKNKVKGDVALDTDEKMKETIDAKHIIPGEPMKSTLLISVKLPDDDEDVMPPKGKNRLTPAEVALVETWIKEGASLTGGGAAPATAAAPAAGAGMGMGSEPAPQAWKNAAGNEIQAVFMGMQGDGVLLKVVSTGVTHIVPLANLSPESQAQAKAAAGQ